MTSTVRENISIPSDLRGAGRVATDATVLLTRLVETMHHNILRTPGVLGTATFAPTRGITGLVYRSVRGITRLAGTGVDAALAAVQPLLGMSSAWPGRDTALAVLNGVLGDYLEGSRNPLAIEMQLRHEGAALELTRAGMSGTLKQATGKVVVLAHGLCMSDRQWTRRAHDHGRELARELGYTPVYLRYNSGLHISANGRQLAALLEPLIANWPVPIEDFVIVGHSMGGLAARVYLRRYGDAHVVRIVTLASPHHGTVFGHLGHSRNARQMARGSRFIEQLAADDRGRWSRFTTVATRDDNLVVPRSSPLLPGARQIEIDGIGHLALLEDRRAWQIVADEAHTAFAAPPQPIAA